MRVRGTPSSNWRHHTDGPTSVGSIRPNERKRRKNAFAKPSVCWRLVRSSGSSESDQAMVAESQREVEHPRSLSKVWDRLDCVVEDLAATCFLDLGTAADPARRSGFWQHQRWLRRAGALSLGMRLWRSSYER